MDWSKRIKKKKNNPQAIYQYQPTISGTQNSVGTQQTSIETCSRSLLVQRKIHRGKAIRGPCHVQFELLWSHHRVNLWKIHGWRPRKWSLKDICRKPTDGMIHPIHAGVFHLMNGGQLFFWSSFDDFSIDSYGFSMFFPRVFPGRFTIFHPRFPNLEEKRRGVMLCLPLLQLRLRKAGDQIDGDAGIHTWSQWSKRS